MSGHNWRRRLAVALLLVAAWQLAAALQIPAKAWLAQQLLERAWATTRAGGEPARPWQWADTWPVARLDFGHHGARPLVLSGASGRNLAFGPVAVPQAYVDNRRGMVVAGHRDTHFRVLEALSAGDVIALERPAVTTRFVVTEMAAMHASDAAQLAAEAADELLLVTCYPFDAVIPGTPWRYVVRAVPGAG